MTISDLFTNLQAWIFETIVQPAMFHLGLGEFVEDAFEGVEWFILGVLQLIVLFLILRPLEAWVPVHEIKNRYARWNDFIYTALHRLGAFSILVFFVLDPLLDQLTAMLHLQGVNPFNLENIWPDMLQYPVLLFLVYLVVLDFFDYWYHRAEHQFNWWWALHSLHHSQRDMNLWSDNRNHLLDDFLRDIYMGLIAIVIGVEPGQYVMLVMASQMLQSLQHANVRIHFGRIGEYLLVSPRYHRTHHAIGIGHETHGKGTLGGHNFAVLFPVWDVLFGTALFAKEFAMTGIRDQLAAPEGSARNYGEGFWSQQWLGLKRMCGFDKEKQT
ncbi:sterol desaturase family protein [Undibacterium pigrum]|uniref:Sterol desaturase/sphingolipid hydroxylase (Fatty acid hydroxylase superfamily) n=1 Tax=Undibacterium pigrum TaxID=401470 RepID=A0A318IZG3_9BURK|nr:sterol desaturase family protein [Undibacterium pigrum]PXX39771.1 sterol desaturase/sphingolipid hydroxylase (fatty acid hydroxylase superfamily) [Undibacterium pigrum]